MSIDLKGRFAVVTGSAGGIGLEFAKELASRGCSLILIDIDETRLERASKELEKSYGNKDFSFVARTLVLNLADEDVVRKVDDFCRQNNISPSILINNAGIFSFNPIIETNVKKLETFIDLHVRAVTLLSQWFCDNCRPRKSGWLLNMSSMSCWMPMPGLSMYASTKSYIRVFTRALHYEMRDYGVKVMVACPGGIATDLFGLPEKLKKLAVNLGVLDTPEKFVRKAVNKLLKGKKQYINGFLNRFSIFFVGITPTFVRMMVKHKLLDKGINR